MGCGASAHGGGPSCDGTSQDGAVLGLNGCGSGVGLGADTAATWATKTDGVQSANGVGNRGLAARSGEGSIAIMDAEDDDEIEIIYESKCHPYASAGSTRSISRSAANGQEAPDSMEAELSSVHSKPRGLAGGKLALSKGQQEEAAKLAEQRKRFDNQRYQRDLGVGGVATPTLPPVPSSPTGLNYIQADRCVSTLTATGVGGEGTPTTPMVIGLNLSEDDARDQVPLYDCLPGGVLDDTPRANKPMHEGRRPQNQHDRFDDDDERLMKEILESVDF